AAVHGGVDAARERVLARVAEVGVGVEAVEAVWRVQRRDGDAADCSGRLLARRGGGDFLLPTVAGGVGYSRHDGTSTFDKRMYPTSKTTTISFLVPCRNSARPRVDAAALALLGRLLRNEVLRHTIPRRP